MSSAGKNRAGAVAALAIALLVVQGCATVPPRKPVPESLAGLAQIEGIPGARHWGDVPSESYFQLLNLGDEQIRARYRGVYGRPHAYLALSGGGARGAFGAGLLAGWTEHGDRPEFTMVSGVSTGALIAPYAFLGPHYDHVIREVYTAHSTRDLYRRKNIFAIVSGDSFSDVSGFASMIEYYLPDRLIDEIGRQYRLGRNLTIGTTNLDADRPVIWDIGAIAVSDHPDRYDLVRKVILASASLPVAFPPVVFQVSVNGETYDELHVDGGVSNQVFVYPLGTNWARVTEKLQVEGRPRLYVVRNAQLDPDTGFVERSVLQIGEKSLDSLMRTQGLGDLYRIYLGARRDRIDFNLAYIPDEFVDESREPIDRNTMNELYNLGWELGRRGYDWHKVPPGARAETEPSAGKAGVQ